jgi:hypothetical protein
MLESTVSTLAERELSKGDFAAVASLEGLADEERATLNAPIRPARVFAH